MSYHKLSKRFRNLPFPPISRVIIFIEIRLENLKGLKGKKAVIVIGGNSVKVNGSLEKTQHYLREDKIE